MKRKMNRNEIFYLIMAVFYTGLCIFAVYAVFAYGGFSLMSVLILVAAVLCAVFQWLRFRKARDEALGIVRPKRLPAGSKSAQDGPENKHEAD